MVKTGARIGVLRVLKIVGNAVARGILRINCLLLLLIYMMPCNICRVMYTLRCGNNAHTTKDNKMTDEELINSNEQMKDKLIIAAVRSSNARNKKPTLDDIVEQSIRSPRLRDNRYEGTTRKDCKQLGVTSHELPRWVVILAAIVLIAVMGAALYKATGTHTYYAQDDRLGYILKTDKIGR